jgi:hypothetical protein
MRIVALALAAVTLSICVGLPAEEARTTSPVNAFADDPGPVTADIEDSDLFFQKTISSAGPERDNSQKIGRLLIIFSRDTFPVC